MRVLLLGAAALAALYLAVLALLWWGQERLIFQPTPLPADHRFDLGPDVHEVAVDVPGARLSALHLRLPHPKGLVFYLHGNAGNLQGWFSNPDFWRGTGYDLFMIDYRGYGKSTGQIRSLAQLEADVRAAFAAVAPRYAGQRIVLFGRSLGTGLAASLAAEVQPDLTILVSPYTSLRALAREHYPWVPAAVLRYPLAVDEALRRVQRPVLLLHGENDTLIPAAHSRVLGRINPRARVVVLPGAGHNDLQGFAVYLDALRDTLAARP